MLILILEFVLWLVAEIFWLASLEWSSRRSSGRTKSIQRPPARLLALVAAAGFAWGFFVNRSTDGAWPRTFWVLLVIAMIAGGLSAANASTESATRDMTNPFLQRMLTFTPGRFGQLALLSVTSAVAVVLGFFLGG